MNNEAEQFGVTQTLSKHNLSQSVFRRWLNQYNEVGVSKLHNYVREINTELDAANEQIWLLKNIVARQQIEIGFQGWAF